MARRSKNSENPLEQDPGYDEVDAVPNYYDEENPPPRPERRNVDFAGSKLSWLVNDFSHVSTSVYEAVMVAAHRSRQIGRKQKKEIDNYNNSTQSMTPEALDEEDPIEKGVDRFHHIKPTVQALDELMTKKFEYYYLENEKK